MFRAIVVPAADPHYIIMFTHNTVPQNSEKVLGLNYLKSKKYSTYHE